MRAWTGVIATAAAVAMVATVSGCSGKIGEDGRIGVVYLNAEGYYAGVERGVQDTFAGDSAAPQLLQTNIQSDASRESTFVDAVSSADVDALIMSPASATASIPAVELAHDSGVPVVCYNTCIDDAAARKYVSAYVLGDPAEFGAASGRQMGHYFQGKGLERPTVAVINCEQFEVCIERRKGFEKALKKLVPRARIVANQEGLTLSEAVERAEQVLTSSPGVDAFYGEAGSQMIGAVRAIESRGLTGKVAVFGGDMSTQAAEMLREGDVLKGITDISGIKVGKLAGKAAAGILAGDPPPRFIVPAPIDEYVGADAASDWLESHPDGIP